MKSAVNLQNNKERLEESSFSSVNAIVPPASGPVTEPDDIKDPQPRRGCMLNFVFSCIIIVLILSIIGIVLSVFPGVWLPQTASFFIPEYKYPTLYNQPIARSLDGQSADLTGTLVEHDLISFYLPYGGLTDTYYEDRTNSTTYEFGDATSVSIQKEQPQNLDTTGTTDLSFTDLNEQLLDITFSDLYSCHRIDDCLSVLTLIITKKSILDEYADPEAAETMASGDWSKYSLPDKTIYLIKTLTLSDEKNEKATLLVVPSEENAEHTLPSLKDLISVYAANMSDEPSENTAPSSENILYTVTIVSPRIDDPTIDEIAGSIAFDN